MHKSVGLDGCKSSIEGCGQDGLIHQSQFYEVLHLGHNNTMQHYKLGVQWLQICLVQKDMWLLVNS